MPGPRRAVEADAVRAEKYLEAWQMRLKGRTERQIADHFGVSQPTISRWLREAWQARLAPVAMQLRALETDKLDLLEQKVDTLIDSVYVTISGGRIVYSDVDGKPIQDTGPILRAMEMKLRIMGLRADLHGYKAPTRVAADVNIVPGIDPALRERISAAKAANDQVVENA